MVTGVQNVWQDPRSGALGALGLVWESGTAAPRKEEQRGSPIRGEPALQEAQEARVAAWGPGGERLQTQNADPEGPAEDSGCEGGIPAPTCTTCGNPKSPQPF